MSEVVEVEAGKWRVVHSINMGSLSSSIQRPTTSKNRPQRLVIQQHSNNSQEGCDDDLQLKKRVNSPDSVMDDVLAFTANQDNDDSDDDDDEFEDTIQQQHQQPPPPSPPSLPPRKRSIRFADEVEGHSLEDVRVIENTKGLMSRVVVLLMSPAERIFEFLHTEYPRDETTTVQILLEQIPKICNNPVFQTQKTFIQLSQTKKQQLLDNDVALRDFDLDEGELLLAVLDGYDVSQMASFAIPLLLNGRIQKAVKHAKRTGRGLKIIKNGVAWCPEQHQHQQSNYPDQNNSQSYDNKITTRSGDSCIGDDSSNLRRREGERVVGVNNINEKCDDGSSSLLPTSSVSLLSGDSRTMRFFSSKGAPRTNLLCGNREKHDGDVDGGCGSDDLEAVPDLDVETEYKIPSTAEGGETETDFQSEPNKFAVAKQNRTTLNSDINTERKWVEVPDLDNEIDNESWRLPEFTDYIGGKEGVEKVMFYIHAVSVVSAAGAFFSSWVR